MSLEIVKLRSEYNHIVKEMRDLHEHAAKEDRPFQEDERAKFEAMSNRLDALRETIEREERLARAAIDVNDHTEGTTEDPMLRSLPAPGRPEGALDEAFSAYLRRGLGGLTPEQRQLLSYEQRDMSLTGASGGFTVPQGFYGRLIETLRFLGGFTDRDLVTWFETDTGNNVPVPLEDDVANAAAIVSEGASLTTSTDPTFSQTTLGAFTYRALVRISLELLQDSAFNLDDYLRRKLALRLWRAFNAHCTTGTGSGQPQGLFNATVGAGIGHTAPTGNTTTFPYTSLVQLEHSVDAAWRRSPSAAFMMSDTLLAAIKLQVDTTGRPLWMPNYTADRSATSSFPGTLLGYRYVVNNDVPAPAANARCVAFGDFSSYIVRVARGVVILRADQRFIDSGQIGYYLFARLDGRYANPTAVAARAPIRLGQNSAT